MHAPEPHMHLYVICDDDALSSALLVLNRTRWYCRLLHGRRSVQLLHDAARDMQLYPGLLAGNLVEHVEPSIRHMSASGGSHGMPLEMLTCTSAIVCQAGMCSYCSLIGGVAWLSPSQAALGGLGFPPPLS